VKDTSASGRVGEYIASAAIESLGWRVTLAPTDAIDLIAMRDGRILRVQVKASNTLPRAKERDCLKYSTIRKAGGTVPKCVDIFAFVDLQQRRARFARPCGRRLVTLHPEDFSAQAEGETWAQICAEIHGDGCG